MRSVPETTLRTVGREPSDDGEAPAVCARTVRRQLYLRWKYLTFSFGVKASLGFARSRERTRIQPLLRISTLKSLSRAVVTWLLPTATDSLKTVTSAR